MAPAAPATTAPRRAPAKQGTKGAPAAGSKATAPKRAPATRAKRNSQAIAGARTAQRAGAAPATRTPAPARRKSGPAARPPQPRPSTRHRQVAVPASPVARVLNGRGMPLVDRLLRGRGWVAIVGALLAGIVFLNVSVLELNRGIAHTDAKASLLERTNSGLRERVARLDSGERIQQLAARQGFVLPQPGDVTFIRPHGQTDAKLAAARITAPNSTTGTTTTTTAAPTTTTAPSTVAPAVTQIAAPGTTAPVPPATTSTTAPVQQPVPAASTPQPVAQSTGTTTSAP